MPREWTQEEIDQDQLGYLSPEEEQEEWDLLNCHMGRDGQCGAAGSEHCDFDCPVMRAHRKR